jgi:hypothetical protein
VGVVPRARPLNNPPIRGPIRRGLALPRDLPPEPKLQKTLAGEKRVVAAIEVDARQQEIENQRLQQAQKIENQRANAERKLADQRAQDETLQAYLNQMSNLLLDRTYAVGRR